MGRARTDSSTTTGERTRPRAAWGLIPATLVSASAALLFGLRMPVPGYLVLAAALTLAFVLNRALFRDLLLIAVGLVIISTISVEANIDYPNIALMGTVLSLSVLVPYLLSRYAYRDHAIRFPIRTGQRWTALERAYLPLVLLLGYLVLPRYFISSGAYLNWPAVSVPDEIARLFVGVGFVGIWDELFFICTVFALLRRHFPDWQANLLQAVIFSSFLWELGYQSWGPLLTFPFALLQGYTFARTRSLTYVVCVHLLFDAVVFLVLVHAHHPQWLAIFWY
ncbi:CPBP family intramembrane glutamic endopeptidase [Cryobacterium psychrophilum]|uniref:CPBP family intramembrane metalloprotease n=1 Tax=Cryobacterium psychrophilum TaxID=41988 RepID=A0A4Y8KQ74_9MICO|nr:CPBP family intramembrane glutamic endopeptidase [Cryobacterium psychrophilum]TDW30014.1 CAAX prenyl protease-like protein [Cryobacterium psychrophilum]TFD75538.1 CPBP family intramembrane metalloprotease [Cryobacterium psychrophilum]